MEWNGMEWNGMNSPLAHAIIQKSGVATPLRGGVGGGGSRITALP
jgi:hypothetical protein